MKDELEDFVNRNRAAFDDLEAPRDSWSVIENTLRFKSQSLWQSVAIWRAAAVLFMATTAYFMIATSMTKRSTVHEQHVASVALREFQDVETYYVRQIDDKVKLIDNFKQSDGLNGFTHDFHQLEAMYMVLKEQMKTNPSDKVKDALVLNLLVRIDLLNQQLHKLEDGHEADKEENKDKDRSV